jgi:mannose-6-phosphate isomerase-like protein (cupin superfamily)
MTEKQGKVWGETWTILQTPMVEFHRISVKRGYRCSTHKHAHKWNGFFVESGELEIHVRKKDYDLTDVTHLKVGQFCAVKPGEYHWFQCAEDCVAFEIYWLNPITEDIQRENAGGKI